MIRKLFILTSLLVVSVSQGIAQADSARIEGYLHVTRTEPVKWMARFDKEIDAFAQLNRTLTDKSCDVLLIGSSSIRLWKSAEADLAPLKVINRGYGGAAIRDMIYNYDVIARGYNPKSIVMFVGNDIAGGKGSLSVGETYDLFRVFAGMIKRDYPTVPFYMISLQPSYRRLAAVPQMKAFNELIADYASRTPNVEFIDVTPGMYDAGGVLRKDIFMPDSLHLNRAGYDVWTKAIKPVLTK